MCAVCQTRFSAHDVSYIWDYDWWYSLYELGKKSHMKNAGYAIKESDN